MKEGRKVKMKKKILMGIFIWGRENDNGNKKVIYYYFIITCA